MGCFSLAQEGLYGFLLDEGNGYSFNLTQCFAVLTLIVTIFGDVQRF